MRVMLSSAAAKVPLLRALRQAAQRLDPHATVLAADAATPVVSQYFADLFWQIPPCTALHTAEILAGLKHYQVSHIVPSRDGELVFWARLKPQLAAAGIMVFVSNESSIQRCLDKQLFAEVLQAKGYPAIPTFGALPEAQPAALWVVKERFGAGSQRLGIALDKTAALQHATKLQQPIFQPYIHGQELSIDAWLDQHGKLKAHCYRYRIKVQHGESQITQTVALPQYDPVVRDILHELNLSGPVVLQAIIDEQQQLHIIECNSRFGGASTLGIAAGVDSLYWSLAESCGHNVAAIPVLSSSVPLTQVRFAEDRYL